MKLNRQWRAAPRLATATLFAACLFLAWPSQAQRIDLDRYSDEQFYYLLDLELGDDDLIACGFGNVNAVHTIEQAYSSVICALRDAGDSADESTLNFADLEAEMWEAETTIEDVVWAAMQDADRRASGPLTREVLIAALRRDSELPSSDSQASYPEWFAQLSNGRVNPPSSNVRTPTKERLNQARRAR